MQFDAAALLRKMGKSHRLAGARGGEGGRGHRGFDARASADDKSNDTT
jgi:hypothetical protein